MLYMGFGWSLEVDASFTLSCLSLTNISIFFVYTHLSRVGVWIGYPYTLDIEILRLNGNRLNENQSNHTNKHLLACSGSISNPSVTTNRIAQNGSRCYFRAQRIAIVDLRSRCGSARTFSGLHIPEEVQPQHGATIAPCTRPRQSALTGHPSTPGRELKELNPEHHVMHSTVLRRLHQLKEFNESTNRRTDRAFSRAISTILWRSVVWSALLLVSAVRGVDKDVVVWVSCSRQLAGVLSPDPSGSTLRLSRCHSTIVSKLHPIVWLCRVQMANSVAQTRLCWR